MYYFIPLYFFVVLNSVKSAESNNETLKIESRDSSSNSNISLPENFDRNSTFFENSLIHNVSDIHYKVNANLVVSEKPLNVSSSEKMEKKIFVDANNEETGKLATKEENESGLSNHNFVERPPFEPSPTLGTVVEYEFNKVPVKPAFPEPRLRFPPPDVHESPWIVRDNIWKASEAVADHVTPRGVGTVEEVKPESKHDYTTVAGTTVLLGTTWNNKGQFATAPTVDRPYQFYHSPHTGFTSSGPSGSGYATPHACASHTGASEGTGTSSYGSDAGHTEGHTAFGLSHAHNAIGPSGHEIASGGPSGYAHHVDGFAFNKPVEVPSRRPNWNYYGEPKTQLDCCPEKKPAKGKSYQSHGYDGLSHYGYSPWKKIIKVLTTIIPLGILISALTPSVIQITNVNDTMPQGAAGETFSRYRSLSSDTSKQQIANHLLSSLEYIEELNQNGCEYRVLCELLLSAKNTKNSKKNVDSLLDSFSERNFDVTSKKKELKRVFDAVRVHDCGSIPCELIKH